MKLILLRHGESNCNISGVIGGHYGCNGMSEVGIKQVEKAADYLLKYLERKGSIFLYSSVLKRATQTAKIVGSKLGISEIIEDCGLCELHPGDADSLRWEDYFELYGTIDPSKTPFKEIAPNGESWGGFIERAIATLEKISELSAGDNATVIVASHGGVIQASLIKWLDIAWYGTKAGLRPEYASITEWLIEPPIRRLLRYNYVQE